MSFVTLWLIGLAAMLAMMAAVWALARSIRNAGIVDIAWSAGFAILALLYAALAPGWLPRKLLVTALVGAWSLRLALHLLVRIARAHPEEDGRYRELRARWGASAERRLFVFFQAQGGLDALLSIPFLLSSLNPAPRFHPLEWAGLGLFLVAFGGESLADRQLAHFKADPANRGKTCRVGLWSWSRHPNYFFEWLIWCAFALFALGSPWGFTALFAPLLMLYFLFRVTGIPATEEQALKSRGEEYREYQRTTSAFVPWPPKAPSR